MKRTACIITLVALIAASLTAPAIAPIAHVAPIAHIAQNSDGIPIGLGGGFQPPELFVGDRRFDPALGLPDVDDRYSVPTNNLLHVVQFSRPLGLDDRGAIEDMGATVLGYIPDWAYLVSCPQRTLPLLLSIPGARTTIPFPPEFKLQRGLVDAEGQLDLLISDYQEGQNVPAIVESLRDMGLDPRAMTMTVMVSAPASLLPRMASLPNIHWIQRAPVIRTHLDNANAFHDNRQSTTGSYKNDGSAMWSFTGSDFEGYPGDDVVVSLGDTGIKGSHPTFPAWKKVGYLNTQNPGVNWQDMQGHGTHTASTAVGTGDGSTGNQYAGAAPKSGLIGIQLPGETGAFELFDWMEYVESNGGQISSWSIGTGECDGTYDTTASMYDFSTRQLNEEDLTPQLYTIATGNDATLSGMPSTAKNVISIGALTKTGQHESYSCAGTTDDRIKPDVCTVGTITAADSLSTWKSRQGTSMSTPLAAGSTACVLDYFQKNPTAIDYSNDWGIANHPAASPALLKASIIAGTSPVGSYPSGLTGWGAINTPRSVFETANRQYFREDQYVKMDKGYSQEYTFQMDGSSEFRMFLVWTDPYSYTVSGKTLVNDLDLTAVAPDGTEYHGNMFSSSKSSANPSEYDRKNNVEGIRLTSPQTGTWTVRVYCYNLGGLSLQDFALVSWGKFSNWERGPSPMADLYVKDLATDSVPIKEGDSTTFSWSWGNQGTVKAYGKSVMSLIHRSADDPGTAVKTEAPENLASGYDASLNWEWKTTRGWHNFTLQVNADGTISESDMSNNFAYLNFTIAHGDFNIWIDGGASEITGQCYPEGSVTYDFTLINNGTLNDTFAVWSNEPAEGWSYSFDPSLGSFEIPSGSTMTVSATVTCPKSALAGDGQILQMSVLSRYLLPQMAYRSAKATTSVRSVQEIGLSTDQDTLECKPGEWTSFELNITNLGNGAKGSTGIQPVIISLDDEVPEGWSIDIPEDPVNVGTDAPEPVEVKVSPPEDGQADDELVFTVRASVEEVLDDRDPEKTTDSVDLTATVMLVSEFEATDEELNTYSEEGEASVLVPVTNTGNGADSFYAEIAYAEEGWEVVNPDGTLDLQAQESGEMPVEITIPPDAEAGEYYLELNIVSATSGTETLITLVVTVEEVYSLKLSSPDGTSPTVTIQRGGSGSVNLAVENLGNVEDESTFDIDSGSGDLVAEAEPDTLYVSPGETQTALLDISAGETATLGEHVITVTGLSLGGDDTDDLTITVIVKKSTGDDDDSSNGDDDSTGDDTDSTDDDDDGDGSDDDDGKDNGNGGSTDGSMSGSSALIIGAILAAVVVVAMILVIKNKGANGPGKKGASLGQGREKDRTGPGNPPAGGIVPKQAPAHPHSRVSGSGDGPGQSVHGRQATGPGHYNQTAPHTYQAGHHPSGPAQPQNLHTTQLNPPAQPSQNGQVIQSHNTPATPQSSSDHTMPPTQGGQTR